MNRKGRLGQRGEEIAARFLEANGYRLREKNYRCSFGEIDLIATTDEYLVFIEVKTRTGKNSPHPSLSVTGKKQAKVRQIGEYYRSLNPLVVLQPRFDVISVMVEGEQERVEHLVNAF